MKKLLLAGLFVATACSSSDTVAPRTPDHIFREPAAINGQAGGTLSTPVRVTVQDANGNGVSDVVVTWTASDGGTVASTTSATDLSGNATMEWTLGPAAGGQTITASVNGIPSLIIPAVASIPQDVVFTLLSGDKQTGKVNTTLPIPLKLKITLSDGRPLSKVPLTWVNPGDAGSVTGDTATGADGIATVVWTLGPNPGMQLAAAQITGFNSQIFTATATQ